MKSAKLQYLALAVSCAALPLLSSGALAEIDLAGKRVEMTVPLSAGGGADQYARYMAAGLAEKLPGKPSVLVKNMPGGGTVVGMNHFESHSDKNGTDIALSSTTTTMTFALRPKDPALKFDAKKWHAFLTSPQGNVVYVHKNTGIKNIEDLKAYKGKELIIGLESPTGADMPNLLSLHLLGVKVKPVIGFDGGDEQLAFERGETTVNGDSMASFMLKNSAVKVPLFSYGIENEKGEIVRDPNVPDMPTFIEVYRTIHGKDPSGPAFDAWVALFRIAVMGSKALVLPAGTDPEVIKAYGDAAAKLAADKEFHKKGVAIAGDYAPLAGPQAAASFAKATNFDPVAREWLVKWLNTELNAGL